MAKAGIKPLGDRGGGDHGKQGMEVVLQRGAEGLHAEPYVGHLQPEAQDGHSETFSSLIEQDGKGGWAWLKEDTTD